MNIKKVGLAILLGLLLTPALWAQVERIDLQVQGMT